MTRICLTEYSHGSGCGCKIAPRLLDEILQSNLGMPTDPRLLVGNQSRDDAAVYDLGDGRSVISTTDFFMPIVDDPFEFGRIAATNAISDIYAMGGTPLMAIAIFGWPIDKLGPEVAQQVIEGGRHTCREAGIPLAGGHSIDAPEPIFGLAVGTVENRHLKRRNPAPALPHQALGHRHSQAKQKKLSRSTSTLQRKPCAAQPGRRTVRPHRGCNRRCHRILPSAGDLPGKPLGHRHCQIWLTRAHLRLAAVTGTVENRHLARNDQALPGSRLYLTKPFTDEERASAFSPRPRNRRN